MSPPPPNRWLDTLRAVAPVQGTFLIGTGSGPLVQWLLTIEHNITGQRHNIRNLLESHGCICQ